MRKLDKIEKIGISFIFAFSICFAIGIGINSQYVDYSKLTLNKK